MFEVRNEAERVEVLLYDEVGERTDWWSGEKHGVSATAFKKMLDEASPKPIDLHIDSPGGDVFDAFAMCSAIQRYPGEVKAYVDGLAASAASYVAVVCDEVVMNDYAYLMIHCASSYARGNARDLEDIAARLRNIDANLAAIYQKRSNLSIQQVLDYMADETWFTAAEAKECGLCTEVAETEERMAACIDPSFADRFRHIPEGVAVRRPEDSSEGKSHAPHTITEEAVKEAAYTVLDGRVYSRRSDQDE
jgi:ATP-dependent Clp protease protease subunit